MNYTANPAADALRHDDMMEAGADATEAALIRYQNEIADGFQNFQPLPIVYAHTGRSRQVRYQSFDEAVSDMMGSDAVFAVLLDALKTSQCPKVKAVLKACAKQYTHDWADLCAGAA
jgi:hypothetical protein